MSVSICKYLSGILAIGLLAGAVHAHEGPLDAYGCHYDRNVGGYHCHKGTFAGHYFESREEMLQMLQLHMADPHLQKEAEQQDEAFPALIDNDD